jgi:hypothetical protein
MNTPPAKLDALYGTQSFVLASQEPDTGIYTETNLIHTLQSYF